MEPTISHAQQLDSARMQPHFKEADVYAVPGTDQFVARLPVIRGLQDDLRNGTFAGQGDQLFAVGGFEPGERSGHQKVNLWEVGGRTYLTCQGRTPVPLQQLPADQTQALLRRARFFDFPRRDQAIALGRFSDGRQVLVTGQYWLQEALRSKRHEDIRIFIGKPGQMKEIKVLSARMPYILTEIGVFGFTTMSRNNSFNKEPQTALSFYLEKSPECRDGFFFNPRGCGTDLEPVDLTEGALNQFVLSEPGISLRIPAPEPIRLPCDP
jgi:hypothetical protein